MGLKLIGIVIALAGVAILFFWDGGGSGIGLNLVLGLLLAVIGGWLYQYDPVADVKESVAKGAAETVRKALPSEEDAVRKVDDAAAAAQRAVRETQQDAKAKIRQLAKEVEKAAK